MDSLTDVFAKRREQLRLVLDKAGTVPQVLNSFPGRDLTVTIRL